MLTINKYNLTLHITEVADLEAQIIKLVIT